MQVIQINGNKYNLERNYKNAFDLDEVVSLCTDYFTDFDYIFGDYSYSKLRLKGFYESDNKKAKNINDIKGLDNYIKKYCSFECSYFLIHKEKINNC